MRCKWIYNKSWLLQSFLYLQVILMLKNIIIKTVLFRDFIYFYIRRRDYNSKIRNILAIKTIILTICLAGINTVRVYFVSSVHQQKLRLE